jgi:hypothetical protein
MIAEFGMTQEEFAAFYADLCDAVFKGTTGWPDDGLHHTSSESRAAASQVIEVLKEWGFDDSN